MKKGKWFDPTPFEKNRKAGEEKRKQKQFIWFVENFGLTESRSII